MVFAYFCPSKTVAPRRKRMKVSPVASFKVCCCFSTSLRGSGLSIGPTFLTLLPINCSQFERDVGRELSILAGGESTSSMGAFENMQITEVRPWSKLGRHMSHGPQGHGKRHPLLLPLEPNTNICEPPPNWLKHDDRVAAAMQPLTTAPYIVPRGRT